MPQQRGCGSVAKKPQVTVVACRDGPNSTSVVFTAVICSMMPAPLEAPPPAPRAVPPPNTPAPTPTTLSMTRPARVQEVPRRLGAHRALDRGGHPRAMSPVGDWHRCCWRVAGDEAVQEEARRREVDLVVLPTAEAIGVLTGTTKDTNAVLHVTC